MGPPWIQGPVQGLPAPVVRRPIAQLAVADTWAGSHLPGWRAVPP